MSRRTLAPASRWVMLATSMSFCVLAFLGRGASAQSAAGPRLNELTQAEKTAGWKLLFDGSTLNGWTGGGTADWKAVDGMLAFTTGRGTLTTTEQYSNFEMTTDFWAAKDANSGVFIRVTPSGSATSFYEININDVHPTAPTASLLNIEPGKPPAVVHSVLPDRPQTAETWNSMAITADGDHIVVKLNGKTMTDVHEDSLRLTKGTIQLQAGGPDGPGPARFRNIKLRVL
jgi:3-keto-disaccharide hydrolase